MVYALSYLQKYARNSNGEEKVLKLKEIEKEIMLDYTQFGFYDQCLKLTDLLAREFACFFKIL